MSATATDVSHQQLIDLCVADLRSSQARVLETFKFIPDDKLTWSPAPQAKSGLRLMAHLAVSNSGISQLLEGGSLPISNFEELERFVEEQERQITTREQAVEAFNQSCDAYERAIRQVPEATAISFSVWANCRRPPRSTCVWPGSTTTPMLLRSTTCRPAGAI
ncbi:MAG: hypothetical protein UZ18_ATM001002190 [Armatimonadetes bacterium OLB18]|nr:MAG: hypothetical protein UZ18_ATM001002190 [Armatimonadetes bacterium OLB18]